MKTIAMLGIVVCALGGCALDAGDEGERTGEAEQAKVYVIKGRTHVEPTTFSVATKPGETTGWVEVALTKPHLVPASCHKGKDGQILLMRQGSPPTVAQTRAVAADGLNKVETFNGVAKGTYWIEIDPGFGDMGLCSWVADVFVTAH